ncbi:SDR family oxidoreductase [Nocardiopsis oceani]
MSLFSVEGKTAVVTGGTSGIGRMIAEGLVKAGARVIVSSRKPQACEETAAELSHFGECVPVPADVSAEHGAVALAEAVRERFDGLHILVNNAGTTWGAPLEDFPDAAWDKLVNLNLVGLFRLTVALLPSLRATGSDEDPARVINIGSLAGTKPTDLENYAYSATKAGAHMLSRHLARRLTGDHITVNTIAPGYFASRMSAFILEDQDARQELEASIPRGRTGRPEDIVGTTLFLSSRAGAYLTGTLIPLDGGVSDCT